MLRAVLQHNDSGEKGREKGEGERMNVVVSTLFQKRQRFCLRAWASKERRREKKRETRFLIVREDGGLIRSSANPCEGEKREGRKKRAGSPLLRRVLCLGPTKKGEGEKKKGERRGREVIRGAARPRVRIFKVRGMLTIDSPRMMWGGRGGGKEGKEKKRKKEKKESYYGAFGFAVEEAPANLLAVRGG